jgi:hypothetical protein
MWLLFFESPNWSNIFCSGITESTRSALYVISWLKGCFLTFIFLFSKLASRHVLPQDLNSGLLDQRVALAFVQENIVAFGGDPAKVSGYAIKKANGAFSDLSVPC